MNKPNASYASSVGALTLLSSCVGLSVGAELTVAACALFFSESASAQSPCSDSVNVALTSSTATEFKSGSYTNINSATTLALAISTAGSFLSHAYTQGCNSPTFTVVLPQGYFRVSDYSNGTTNAPGARSTASTLGVIDVSGNVPEYPAGSGGHPGTLIILGQGPNEFTSAYTVLITDDDKLAILGNLDSVGVTNPGPSNNVTFSGIHFARQSQTVSQGTITSGGLSSNNVTLKIDTGYPSPASSSFYDSGAPSGTRYLREYTSNAGSDPGNVPHLIPSIGFPHNSRPSVGTTFTNSPLYNNDQVEWTSATGTGYPSCTGSTSLTCTLTFVGTNSPSWTAGSSLICLKSKNRPINRDAAYFDNGKNISFDNINWTERSRLEFDSVTNVSVTNSGIRRRYFAGETALPCLSTPEGGPQLNASTGTISNYGAGATGDDSVAFSNQSFGTITNMTSFDGFARGIYINNSNVYATSNSVTATPSANGVSGGNSITTVITSVPGSTTLYNDYLNCQAGSYAGCPIHNYPYIADPE